MPSKPEPHVGAAAWNPREKLKGRCQRARGLNCVPCIWSKAGLWFVRAWLGTVTLRVRITWPHRTTGKPLSVARKLIRLKISLSVIPAHFLFFSPPGPRRVGHGLSYTLAQPSRSHKDNRQFFKAGQIPDNFTEDFPSTLGQRAGAAALLIQLGAIARTGRGWDDCFAGWKGTSEWHLCWGPSGRLWEPQPRLRCLGCESMELFSGKQTALKKVCFRWLEEIFLLVCNDKGGVGG